MVKKRFGICIPVYGRLYSPKQAEPSFEAMKKIAIHADRWGYYWIRIPDHLVNPTGSYPGRERRDRWGQGAFEMWTTLSALSTVTFKVKLNGILNIPLRYPSLVAKMAATLDQISKGRLMLTLGAGWFKGELEAYGMPWKSYKARLEMLKESILLMKKVWTEEEVTFKGKHYRLDRVILNPKPVQKPHPPIWVGGASENVTKIAVDEAEGWDINAPWNVIEQRMQQLDNYCKEVGRNRETLTISHQATPFLSRNIEEAKKSAKIWAEYADIKFESLVSSGQAWIGTSEDIAYRAEKMFEGGIDVIELVVPQDINYLKKLTRALSSNLKHCFT